MNRLKSHWERVYESRDSRTVSWFQEEPAASLRLIDACAPTPST